MSGRRERERWEGGKWYTVCCINCAIRVTLSVQTRSHISRAHIFLPSSLAPSLRPYGRVLLCPLSPGLHVYILSLSHMCVCVYLCSYFHFPVFIRRLLLFPPYTSIFFSLSLLLFHLFCTCSCLFYFYLSRRHTATVQTAGLSPLLYSLVLDRHTQYVYSRLHAKPKEEGKEAFVNWFERWITAIVSIIIPPPSFLLLFLCCLPAGKQVCLQIVIDEIQQSFCFLVYCVSGCQAAAVALFSRRSADRLSFSYWKSNVNCKAAER